MNKLKVLITDADAGMLNFIEQTLSGNSHEVVKAKDGADAYRVFRRQGDFDLIITGNRMPGMTGEDLITMIRAENTRIEIIWMSHKAKEKGFIAHAQTLGVTRLLGKPFKLSAMMEMITELSAAKK